MNNNIPLYIFGSSGHAREIAAYFRQVDSQRLVFFVEREPSAADCISVAEYRSRIQRGEPGDSILGSGRCHVRARMLNEILPPFATFVHPTAVVMGEIGKGCVIAPNAVVAPNAILGAHVLVNYNATVGHDTVVDRLCVIGPTAAVGGFCRLEERVYIGAGAMIREQLKIGAGAVIGMGTVVTKNVAEETVIAGVPGREMLSHSEKRGWL